MLRLDSSNHLTLSSREACVVTSVTTDGLIADWNFKCSEETKADWHAACPSLHAAGRWTCQVQKYDRLYAVNGQASEKSKDT